MADKNVFVKKSKKAQKTMAQTEKQVEKRAGTEKDERKTLIAYVPADLHKKILLHRVETGESMSATVVRLLQQEFGDD